MHNGLVILGAFILVMGLLLSFYYESKSFLGVEYQRVYPYQNVGIALFLGGLVCAIVGVVYSPKKETITHVQQTS